jgi:RNA polymerase sigma-70 factor, ECF subfamily
VVGFDAVTSSETHRTVEAVWRIESARLVASLARLVRDVGVAEELAQDALVAALEQWPTEGIPAKPGAWLLAVAKHRALDRLRRGPLLERTHAELGRELDARSAEDLAHRLEALDDPVGDDRLRLIFTACHPVLPRPARVALTLRLLGGLTTEEIARAFLVSEPTIAQRLVRAKRSLAAAQVPFEVPQGGELSARLASVLEVVYLIFNEGYAATAGSDWLRPALCEEALRLGRILAQLAPQEPEVHGLLALLELQASRNRARLGPGGEPILLLEQNRARWDPLLLRRGLAGFTRAERLSRAQGRLGPYTLQAAIAACHARARRAEDTDWARIAALYEILGTLTPSPLLELNRAVALAHHLGPAAALDVVEPLRTDPTLANHHHLPTVRGNLLAQLGRHEEARAELERAAALTRNERERQLLRERAETLEPVPCLRPT